MEQAGIIGPDENYELIEGEIVPMQAKNDPHERVKSAIIFELAPALRGGPLWIGLETSLRLSDNTMLEPDFCVYNKALRLREVRGPDILLAIEVSDSSLWFDKGRKARLYAGFGVHELWVVNANTLVTTIHRRPGAEGWAEVSDHPGTERIAPATFPGFAISVAEAMA
ncbi:MAG: Uma2 family endonuclease [Acidisphaera sp.]|nr:Uma2 family endonuclease [Acidisphaera sp.]MBV9813570.1 Uma2 family endonuclease [Acetobacteraceae bacterium]